MAVPIDPKVPIAMPGGARSGTGRRIKVIVGATACGFIIYYALTWSHFIATVGMCGQLFCDFIDYYFPMGETIFGAAFPVSGFLYSPFIAIALALFPPLGLDAALVVWGGLQGLGVIICILLFRRLVPAGNRVHFLFAAILLSHFPLAFNFLTGQVSVFIMAASLGMLLLYDRGYRVGAAAFLAFAVSFKFYPIIFLAPPIARRDLRLALYTALASLTILCLIPAMFLGVDGTWSFYESLVGSFRASDWVVANVHSQYAPHVVLRFADAVGYDARSLLPLLSWIAFGVAVVNFCLIFLIQRARIPLANLWSFELVFLSLPFVLKTSWPHDFIFLPVAQALLAWWILEGDAAMLGTDVPPASPHGSASTRARTVVMTLLIISIVISNIAFFNLFGVFVGYSFSGCLFWSNLMILLASYIVLLSPALRRLRALAQ